VLRENVSAELTGVQTLLDAKRPQLTSLSELILQHQQQKNAEQLQRAQQEEAETKMDESDSVPSTPKEPKKSRVVSDVVRDIEQKGIDLNDRHLIAKSLLEADLPDIFLDRERHIFLSEQLLQPDKREAALDELYAAIRDSPRWTFDQVVQRFWQSGQFTVNSVTYRFPPCKRGQQCFLMAAKGYIGTAFVSVADWEAILSGRLDIRSTNPCLFCWWVAYLERLYSLRSGYSDLETEGIPAVLLELPFQVNVGGEQGFKEDSVLELNTSDLTGTRHVIPNGRDEQKDVEKMIDIASYRCGNPRMDTQPTCHFPVLTVHFPKFHTERMKVIDGPGGQKRMDMSGLRSAVDRTLMDIPVYTNKIKHAWYQGCIGSCPREMLQRVNASDSPLLQSLLQISEPPPLHLRPTWPEFKALIPRRVLADMAMIGSIPDDEKAWQWLMNTNSRTYWSFVRWCLLVRRLATAVDLEATLYVMDAQWPCVWEVVWYIVNKPFVDWSRDWQPAEWDSWILPMVPLSYTELPTPQFIPDAFCRRTEQMTYLRYLWEKIRAMAFVFRTADTKALQMMKVSPHVRRYINMTIAIALLNGCGDYKPHMSMPAPPPVTKKRDDQGEATARAALKRIEAMEVTEDYELDLAYRALVHREWHKHDRMCSPNQFKSMNPFEWIISSNQYVLITAMQATMLNYCKRDIAYDLHLFSIIDVPEYARQIRINLLKCRATVLPNLTFLGTLASTADTVFTARLLKDRVIDQLWWAATFTSLSNCKTLQDQQIKQIIELAAVKTIMNADTRELPRTTTYRTSFVELLFHQFAIGQDPIGARRLETATFETNLGYDDEQMTPRLLQYAQASARAASPDGWLFKFLHDVECPIEVMALLARCKFQHQTSGPSKKVMKQLDQHEHTRPWFRLARAFAALHKRYQMCSLVALPVPIRDRQLAALQKRLGTQHVPAEATVVYMCDVCMHIKNAIRPIFHESLEAEVLAGTYSLTDIRKMCDVNERLCRRFDSIIEDPVGGESHAFDIATQTFRCRGVVQFNGVRCGDRPLKPVCLLGFMAMSKRMKAGHWITFCPECGVPATMALSNGLICSHCISLRSAKDPQVIQTISKDQCVLCRRYMTKNKLIIWQPYGWHVCTNHDRDKILRALLPGERYAPTKELLQLAYATTTKEKRDHRQIRKVSSLVAD
jgi:hypothetical protein